MTKDFLRMMNDALPVQVSGAARPANDFLQGRPLQILAGRPLDTIYANWPE
jgi:hypothetical protein